MALPDSVHRVSVKLTPVGRAQPFAVPSLPSGPIKDAQTSFFENVHETQQNHGYRLNAIDGRLALIEKHTGMIKA